MKNREIKFRVFNGHSMEENVTVGKFGAFYVNPENGDGLNPKDTASLSNNTTKYHENISVMQYSGLKDKKDKEIFEGDLVKHNGDLMLVSFSERFSSFGLTKKGWLHFHFFGEAADHRECEIIGNIYENPELLSASAKTEC